MQQAGTRHRRTQSSSISQRVQPIEIVVTSPSSEIFPLSPNAAPIRANLYPPSTSTHDSSDQDFARASDREAGGQRWKVSVLIVLVIISLAELLHYGKKSYEEANERGRIFEAEKEDQRNLERREIASKLFPNITFYPASSPSSSTTATPTSQRGYLFPVRIAEQESKAQQHLHQLALLAISLNRTLILPNVGGSRLHSCHLFPFAFHYDIDRWLEQYEGKLLVVGEEDWLQAIESDSKVRTITSVRLVEGKKVSFDKAGARAGQEEKERLDLSDFCLDKYATFFEPAQPLVSTLYAPLHYREFDDPALASFSNGLVSSLSRFSPFVSSPSSSIPLEPDTTATTASEIPTDVLFVDYNLRYPIFPSSIPNSADLTPPPPPPSIDSDDTKDQPTLQNTTNGTDQIEEPFTPVDIALYNPFPLLRPLTSASSSEDQQHPFLSFQPLPYSVIWTDLATSIAEQESPYAGVHWRMESVPSSHLSSCATSLANLLDSLSTDIPPPATIYIASDYSFDSVVSPSDRSTIAHSLSDTFTDLTSSHRAAASRLVRLLRPSSSFFSSLFPATFFTPSQPPLKLRTLATVLDSNPSLLPPRLVDALGPLDGDLFALDSGLKGILDKLVLARANYFVAGSAEKGSGMCGKGSSFTESVLDQRRNEKERLLAANESEKVEEEESEIEGEDAAHVGQEQLVETDEDIVRWFKRPER